MAISKNLKENFHGIEIEFKNAYVKVAGVTGDKNLIIAAVDTYSADRLQRIKQQYYEFQPDISTTASNFIQQSYEYLKTLSEYADAVDILEDGQTL